MTTETRTSLRNEPAGSAKKGVMLMNRIGPSSSTLYIANADGSEERLLLPEGNLDYHASFSPDGQWITFTSERNGDGQADVFRCRPDGSDVQPVVATPSVEDALVLSPDGTQGAFVSTADGYRANIWTVDLATGERRKLKGGAADVIDPEAPIARSARHGLPTGRGLLFPRTATPGGPAIAMAMAGSIPRSFRSI